LGKIQGQALYNKKRKYTIFCKIEENISTKKLLRNQQEELVVLWQNQQRIRRL
jgi:hypothetical protein